MSEYGNHRGEDCRTCTDFKTWARKQKERFQHNKTMKQVRKEMKDF